MCGLCRVRPVSKAQGGVAVVQRVAAVVDVGFQAEMGLDGLRDVAAPVAPARLDTGGLSPQVFESFGKQGVQTVDGADVQREQARRRKRGYHLGLVQLLGEMANGQHGGVAEAVGNKLLEAVKKCPGTVRRHLACGQASFVGHRCDCQLCPWCQARRAKHLVKRLAPLVAGMWAPKLWTFSPPNLAELSNESVGDLGKALTALHRQAYFQKRCRGGIRALEVTKGDNGWNLHAHEGVDADWAAHYPQWDITPRYGAKGQWLKRPWAVNEKHPGLAREFTRQCQRFASLKSPRLDFDLDNPTHWYFVDLRVAYAGIASELAKYVVKGSQVVGAGPRAVVEYLMATRSHRLIQPFGSLYGEPLENDAEPVSEEPARDGECPYNDCPEPGHPGWLYLGRQMPLGAKLEYNRETGTSRIRGSATSVTQKKPPTARPGANRGFRSDGSR